MDGLLTKDIVKNNTYLLIYLIMKKTKGLPFNCAKDSEKHIFHIYFLNMDISLIMTITGMEIAIHVAETHLEGRVSQNFDIGLSFCFIVCRRLNF